jgi:hypothetical protein
MRAIFIRCSKNGPGAEGEETSTADPASIPWLMAKLLTRPPREWATTAARGPVRAVIARRTFFITTALVLEPGDSPCAG